MHHAPASLLGNENTEGEILAELAALIGKQGMPIRSGQVASRIVETERLHYPIELYEYVPICLNVTDLLCVSDREQLHGHKRQSLTKSRYSDC